MHNLELEKVIDQMPVYGSRNRQVGMVGDIQNPEYHDQIVHDVKRSYQGSSEDETD